MSTNLIKKFADKFHIDERELIKVLKATAFRQKAEEEISDEQLAALMIVADQYGLNPFIKEIYAYPDKNNGIVPVVGIDGWIKIINSHPDYDGMSLASSDEIAEAAGAKSCPTWMECVIFRKGINNHPSIREYLDECYRPPFTGRGKNNVTYEVKGPWQTHTKRMLRHKVIIQAGRATLGFVGIYDEDEAQRIIENDEVNQDGLVIDSVIEQQNVTEDVPQLEYYPQDRYEKNSMSWADLILSGTKTLEEIESTIKAKGYTLTEEQKKDLRGFIEDENSWPGTRQPSMGSLP